MGINKAIIDEVALEEAKKVLYDLENNIKLDKKVLCLTCILCLTCKHFIKNEYDIVNPPGFGSMGLCKAMEKDPNYDSKISIPVWKCEVKEKEARDLVTKLEIQVDNKNNECVKAWQFINYKESIDKKIAFLIWWPSICIMFGMALREILR